MTLVFRYHVSSKHENVIFPQLFFLKHIVMVKHESVTHTMHYGYHQIEFLFPETTWEANGGKIWKYIFPSLHN